MRRSFVTAGLAVLCGAGLVQAKVTAAPPAQQQTAAAPAAQQPAAAPADPLKFTTDDAAVIIQVQPAKASDFEAGFKAMLTALSASEKPDLKAFGATMTLMKAATGPDNALYVLQVHGASHDLSYNWGKVIYYSGKEPGGDPMMIFGKREEADACYKQINDSILAGAGGAQQVSVLPLTKIGG